MSDRMYFDPPSTDGQDDPRKALYARVGDLIIDTTKQRDVNPEKIQKMGEWTWEKAEAPTLVERSDGTLAVIEGQNRVIKLQGIDQDIHIWTMVLPPTDEARLSLEIATSRTGHNSFQRWDQERKAGGALQLRVQAVLESQGGLYLTGKVNNRTGSKAIAAIGAVRRIVAMAGDLDDGIDLLDNTLTVLIMAFPAYPKKMWEGTLLKAVAGLIYRNDLKGERLRRLAQKLGAPGLSPELWLAEPRKHDQSPLDAVSESIAFSYNHSLREENKIR